MAVEFTAKVKIWHQCMRCGADLKAEVSQVYDGALVVKVDTCDECTEQTLLEGSAPPVGGIS